MTQSSVANTHVIATTGGRWAVRLTGRQTARKVFDSQGDAVKFARDIAKLKHNNLFIHRRDGTILQMDSYSTDAALVD